MERNNIKKKAVAKVRHFIWPSFLLVYACAKKSTVMQTFKTDLSKKYDDASMSPYSNVPFQYSTQVQ